MSREEHIRAAMEGSCERGGPRRWSGTPRSTGDGASSERTSVWVLGLGGCTGGTSCFRTPDGDQGRCIVCSFLGPKAAPKASAASTMPAPPEVEGVEESPSAKPVSNAVRVEVDVVVVPSDER